MNYRELIKRVRNDEKIINDLIKNIKREVKSASSFNEKFQIMSEVQKEYENAVTRLNKVKAIYEKNTTETELPQ